MICIINSRLEGNDTKPDLVLNGQYVVKKEHTCKCGEVHFDVGLKSELNYVTCYKCREVLPDSDHNIHWCHSSRFLA
jgi:hypothetical protein